MIVALTARAEPEPRHVSPPSNRVWNAILIGASGLVLAGGYTAGAFLTGDQPAARPLAIIGGVGAGGMLGVSLALGLGATREDPGSLVGYILRPVIGALAGAVLGGVLAGFGAWQPGTLRTVTHAIIIGLVITDTVIVEIARLVR